MLLPCHHSCVRSLLRLSPTNEYESEGLYSQLMIGIFSPTNVGASNTRAFKCDRRLHVEHVSEVSLEVRRSFETLTCLVVPGRTYLDRPSRFDTRPFPFSARVRMRSKEGLGSFSIDSGVWGHEDALSSACVKQHDHCRT
ncbi:hypothetical protein K443DRAFT_372300 [Laccaria amethystina LaAM-08-1]|uniref:Uncharacterized protein n=1 Tax=Laccaria amethystina LaAM-08-1 TaxID=1095629 RepID=A0A0C9X8S3_9AGAR|nr:hypothetical protein K443DRAFT_372300 [Laccaria amethystina LaAM-08-1]